MYALDNYVACRHCLKLKYDSQYRKDVYGKRDWNEFRIQRYHRQKRRFWYGDKHTQFGRRYYKLREEQDIISREISEDLRLAAAKLTSFRV